MQIRERGNWVEDIVCLSSEKLSQKKEFQDFNSKYSIETKIFKPVDFSNLKFRPDLRNKPFQYHKYYVFHPYFKKWDYVFYIDVRMMINGDLNRFRKLSYLPGRIYAHCDGYPTYEKDIRDQFPPNTISEKCNFFQTTMFIFHTELIENTTIPDLVRYTFELPSPHKNDQAIIAYYYCVVKPCWEQIPTCDTQGYLYDYLPRDGIREDQYVMLKIKKPLW